MSNLYENIYSATVAKVLLNWTRIPLQNYTSDYEHQPDNCRKEDFLSNNNTHNKKGQEWGNVYKITDLCGCFCILKCTEPHNKG